MRKRTILLLEDTLALLNASQRMLELMGYDVLAARNIQEARALLATKAPDAMVLDILLPDGSGLTFCQEIRMTCDAPILFLTALGEKDDIIQGLRCGGDDYLTKPFDYDVLLARVEALLRRADLIKPKADSGVRMLGSLRLDTVAGRAYLREADMLLAPKEFLVLNLLATQERVLITREALYAEIWKASAHERDAALKNVIYRLRQKLQGSGLSIEGERGEGYLLILNHSAE